MYMTHQPTYVSNKSTKNLKHTITTRLYLLHYKYIYEMMYTCIYIRNFYYVVEQRYQDSR